MRTSMSPVLLVALSGCNAGHKIQSDGPPQSLDAAHIDAAPLPTPDAPRTITLSQTADRTVAPADTLACTNSGLAFYGVAPTRRNEWYRVFDLPSYGITGPFRVTKVTFGLQESSTPLQNSDNSSILISLYTYAGTPGTTLDTSKLTLKTADVHEVLTSMDLGIIEHPIVQMIPAGSKLVVGIFGSDYNGSQRNFYAGSSDGAETSPAYQRSPECGYASPTSIKSINTAAGSLIIEVTGTY